MNKPWKSEARGAQLEAFVGAFGIHTSQFKTSQELVWFACRLFEIDPNEVKGVAAAASAIEALGKKERSARARRNRAVVFPNEDFTKAVAAGALITEEALEAMMAKSTPQLVDGAAVDVGGEIDLDPAQLLRKVVSAVISAGRSDILWEFPAVLAFFGSRIPDREEAVHLHNIDERQFQAKERWAGGSPK